jgi:hypothetical protein
MKLRSCSLFFITIQLALTFTPILAVSAQNKGDYYQSVATSCENTLNASGRTALWKDIRAAKYLGKIICTQRSLYSKASRLV